MDSKHPKNELLFAPLAAVLSALLFYFGTGLHPVWWLTWLAPLPVLFYAGQKDSRWWLPITLIAVALSRLNQWNYLHNVIELPILVCILASIIPALLFTLCVWLWRRLVRRERLWAAAFSLPLAWTTLSYLNAVSSPHSTFDNIAYSQMNFLAFLQIASLTGIWGMVFLLVLVPSAVGVALSSFGTPSTRRNIALTASAILVSVLGFGVWRLNAPLQQTGVVAVKLLTNDVPGQIFSGQDARSLELLKIYARELAPQAAETGVSASPGVFLLPEKIARLSAAASDEARGIFSQAAANNHADLLVGLDEVRGSSRRNDALLFTADGTLAIDYEKHHFIPVIEDGYVSGNDYAIVQRPSGTWGVAICKDMDFPAMGREYGKRGVGLLLVPAWDFKIDGWLHGRMAILRGVESGFSIARSAKQGILTVTDNRGRILAERSGSTAGIVSLAATAPAAHADTLYTRWGDWFAWLCCAGLLVSLIAAFPPAQSKLPA